MEFHCKDHTFLLNQTYVMGILNITPDSFSDGGYYLSPVDALRHAREMAEHGAHCIDIGAQSTRPGHTPVSPGQEVDRLEKLLPDLLREINLPISVDTYYPEVAAYAAQCGVQIINDVGGTVDPQMAEVIRTYRLGWVIMHAQAADGPDPAAQVHDWLAKAAIKAESMGVHSRQICLDPGIGFNKDPRVNLLLLRDTSRCKVEGHAYLVGASRKRFIGACCGNPPPYERDAGSIAAHTAAILGGADFIRVHDTRGGVQAAQVADSIRKGDINGSN